MEDLIQVHVKESALDFATGQYRVVLKDNRSDRILPIWVGYFEGSSIALALEQAWTPRPMTHDLAVNLITRLQGHIERIIVTDLKDNTFYAVICIMSNGETVTIDSRPSDAIAIAVRMNSPIFISNKIADKMTDEIDELFDRLEPKDTVH